MHTDILLRSNAIFTGLDTIPTSGCLAISGNKITAISSTSGEEFTDSTTHILDLGDHLVCPSFVDTHCFFTGYLLTVSGKDFAPFTDVNQVIEQLHHLHTQSTKESPLLLGRNLKIPLTTQILDNAFPSHPVILFYEGGESCSLNTLASETFQFTPETCWSESYWRLLKYLLQQSTTKEVFRNYMSLLNSKGITAIKEMGFDDYWGFTDVLTTLELENKLTTRVHYMSQPVGAAFNLSYGQTMHQLHHSKWLRFSGFNQMTDGSISQTEGEMKEPYLDTATRCTKTIDWDTLEKDVLTADANGLRFSLHAQGDGAIAHAISIFDKCQKDTHGKLLHRHAITDLECSDPRDLEKMGELGIIAEIYPQIMSIANYKEKVSMIHTKIGEARGKNYWNRRKMVDANIPLCCATDLPLLVDDIPESIYHTVGGFFPEGGLPFNPENTLTISELLRAWSYGGQYNLGQEDCLGTLAVGKIADITIFDRNLFTTPLDTIRDAKVCCTIVDGKIVYQTK